ncbi:uncharacterized protein LOC118756415 [Rhagoletis pomonella]|uniref:uncharacterized protein LOC118756415 n=1 Tax=Rhagoletis pomonella TaxID=28610 RepID=UPI00177CBBF1|nr:uncharacterized protein LOC118756415 [Rhagoletis pomonella]
MPHNSEDNVPDMSDEEQALLSSLLKQRSNILRNLLSMKQRIGCEEVDTDTHVLECRLQIVESYFQHISDVQNNIEALVPTDSSRVEIEETYISTKSKILSLINSRNRTSELNTSMFHATAFGNTSHHNRLPSLKLPKFDGKYAEYKRFFRTFCNMVHDDPTMPKVDKFNYLLNCLSGPALSVIEPFQVTEENYPKAIQRLKERYDNNVLIFQDYITSIFNIPMMKRSDAASLRNIIDTVAALRGSLLSLGSKSDIMNSMLIHIVLTKIDSDSKAAYNQKQEFDKLPAWEDCYKWLNRHSQYLETFAKGETTKVTQRDGKLSGKKTANSFVNATSNCIHCNSAEHNLNNCSSFLALPAKMRFDWVKQAGACINCLRKGHTVSKCPSKSRCRVCHQSHHSHLHFASVATTTSPAAQTVEPKGKEPTPPTSSSSNPINPSVSLIARTQKRALIHIQDKFGVMQPARALLDSCSEVNFITEETAKRLQLKRFFSHQEISGISDIRSNSKYAVNATIKSRIGNFTCISQFAITKRISTHIPCEVIDTSKWNIPEEIQLADPYFYKPQRIDVLLNAEIFFDSLQDGKISLGQGLPCLHNSKLGWIVGGNFEMPSNSRPSICNVTLSSNLSNIDSVLQRFWEIEDFTEKSFTLSEEERLCEQHFVQNVQVNGDGRVQVRLPFKVSPTILGNSFYNARRRFLALERRLTHNKLLRDMYSDFIQEYIALGHMSAIQNFDFNSSHYVIPHHCILRPQSTTTKLRVVFDASARTTSDRSLNDILMVGATIQPELINTLLSFRLHPYVLTADVSKMYRQFLVDEQDQRFQLILWRNETNEPLQLFQLKTVTYGLASAPFLAIRSMFHIAAVNQDAYPLAASAIRESFYVDDLLTGAESIDNLQKLKEELVEVLLSHGLSLTKWHSNSAELSDASCNEVQIKTNEENITKTLGMSWKPSADTFCYRYELPDMHSVTKRSVLSIISKIFDILGLLSPVIIRGKILMQEIWIRRLDWDETLPPELHNIWLQIKSDLNFINTIELPRYTRLRARMGAAFTYVLS